MTNRKEISKFGRVYLIKEVQHLFLKAMLSGDKKTTDRIMDRIMTNGIGWKYKFLKPIWALEFKLKDLLKRNGKNGK